MAICMVASVVPDFVLPVSAQTTSKEDWGHNSTGNLIPELKVGDVLTTVGWKNIGVEINKEAQRIEDKHNGSDYTNRAGIQALGSSDDIGDKNYNGGVYWQIDFSAEDQVKINKGDLELSASARYWIQATATHWMSLRFEFYDSKNNSLDIRKETLKKTKYFAGDETVLLNLDYVKIPQNTTYVKIWFSNWGSISGRPFIGDFEAHLIDWVAPKAIEDVHEYAVNGSTTLPEYVVPEDTVTYAVRFDEAVKVNNSVSIKLSNGISTTTRDIEYSADRQTVYVNVEMPDKSGKSVDLRLTDIYFTLMDDAERQSLYSKSDVSIGSLQYKSKFNVVSSLTNLNSSGSSTAHFGNNYTAKLTPKAGYKLPESITVKVSGKTVTDYTYSNSTGAIKVNSAAIKGDIEIIATAQLQSYTVTFNKQSGSGGTNSVQATYTQAMPNITPPTRAGYTFGGYYDAAGGTGTQYYDFNGNPVKNFDKTANTTLYAKWTAKSYTVTLDAVGGNGSRTITAEYDAQMPTITKPTRKGYTFRGYFTQQNGNGTKYYNADGTSARKYDKTDGLTLFAAWSANTYTVTFDKQGGSGGSDSTRATYDSNMPRITPPTRPGYTFKGYFSLTGGKGSRYYESTGSWMLKYNIDGDATLYAHWEPRTYDVVLNAQGGSGGSTVTATYGSNMPPIAAPDKPGYNFGGYYSQPNGGGELFYRADCTSAKAYDKSEGITLYAKWTPITYNIRLYSRGEYVKNIDNVTYGHLNLPSAEDAGITYPNYKFVGWNIYDEQNWAMYTADRTYSTGLVTEQGKTAYLYAAWLEKDKYTVTYDANGGEGAPSAVEVHVDEVITLSGSMPTRQDYTFLGWAASSDATAAEYQPGDSYTMGNSIVTLFAVWSKNPELTYNANGGVFTSFAAAAYPPVGSSVALTSAVPQKEGYRFVGWAESETATVSDIVASPYTMPNHDTVLYAVYEPIRYTVAVDSAAGYSVSGINAGGYVFGEYAGFTVSGTAPKVYINGVLTEPLGGLYRFEVTKNSSVVVTDASKINVIYNANGGTDAPIDNNGYSNGDLALIKNDKPTRVGYSFIGWARTASAAAKDFNAGDVITAIAEDIILYAVWEPIEYTIKYDTNGGSGTMGDTAAVYDEMTALAKNAYEKTGSQFVGWAYAADGEIAYADRASVKNLTAVNGGEVVLYAIWRGAKTKINFRFEGGTSGTPSSEAAYGKPLTADNLIAPTRHGYKFGGYYTAPNEGGNMVYNSDMIPVDTNPWSSVAAELDLYAAWEPISYTVAFVNGTDTIDTMPAVYGNPFRLPTAESLGITVSEGWSFPGWSVASGSDAVYYTDGQEIVTGLADNDGDTVYLYAVIRKNVSYTIKYDKNTTEDILVPGVQTKEHGKVLTISSQIPTRVGYTFDRWNTAADGSGTSYHAGGEMSANADVTLYAQWKINKYPVTLITGEGVTGSLSANEVEYGGTVTVTAVSGDGFAEPTITAIPSENAEKVSEGVYRIKGAVSFVASAAARATYTARFYLDGGLYYVQSAIDGSADKITLPNPPAKQGCTFVGWFTAQTGGDRVDETTALDRDMSVYAQFEVNKYTVTLPSGRSEFAVNATSAAIVDHGGDFTFSITVADGYNAADMTVYANGILIEKISESGNTVNFEIKNITSETVVTVRGIGKNTYSVTYDQNTTEYVGNLPENLTKTHDDDVTISECIPERYGYDFIGWAESADGAASYFGGDVYSDNADIRLYAVWEAKTFAVSFETNGGIINGGEIAEYTYGTGVMLPTDVSKSGYTFVGWYEDEGLQGARVYEIKAAESGDKKYYAAYAMANVTINDYSGKYDGKTHELSYTINDDLTVENYQWYFVPAGASEATAVASDMYNRYEVKDAAQSGEYYCYVEALQEGFVIRFFTERSTVAINRKAVTVKAADGAKVYDAQPLATNETEFTGEDGLVEGHKITAAMTSESSIINVGTAENRIELIVISDGDGKDVTENYEVTTQVGTLSIRPRTLTVEPQKVSVGAWIVLNESSLYKIVGNLGDEALTLANASFTAKDAGGKEISLSDITKTAGTYTVAIVYNGFDGDGSGNYIGSGTVTSEVTVYKKSSGGGGSGGGSSAPTAFTVSFDSNGGRKVDSLSVKKGGLASEPAAPQRDGYTFDGWYSDSGLTEKFDFAAKITKDITLYAKWTADEPDDEANDENLSVADPTKTGVANLLETEAHIAYLNGNTDGTFRPDSNMTRAEAAQMFYNLLIDKTSVSKMLFDDVSARAWYRTAVATLGGMGIINGVGIGKFNPDGEISRAEFVAMAMRFVNADVNSERIFADVSQNHWAAKDISAAAALGWISGNDDGTFGPDESISRACVAKIVNSMLGRKADIEYIGKNKKSIKIFGDVSADAWYFGDVAEAANAHDYEKSAENGTEIWK